LNRALIRRTAIFSLVLPFLYFGTASATFLYRIHAENSDRANVSLPLSPAVHQGQRLLIFSPHPDDETLGCAGVIQQARDADADVRVAFLTNGDGFRVGVERQFRKLDVQPSDYVQFASIRQQEVVKALGPLGVDRDHISFLGYPDRGLLSLWNDHWSTVDPYSSPYTRASRSPYQVAYRRGSTYCGQSLLDDVKAILRESSPTDVYVTHPSDDHMDHTAASSFVALALWELSRTDPAFAKCRLHYYIVHRGDWPAPQGMYTSDSLVPPSEMVALDTAWTKRPLTEEQVSKKSAAILTYESQTSVMKRFLVSFARQNELFGTLKTDHAPTVPDGAIQLDGRTGEWGAIPPLLLDPVNDNLLRDFQAGGDVRAVYVCRDSASLYVRIDTKAPVSDRVEFRLGLRYFGDPERQESGGSLRLTIKPSQTCAASDVRVETQGNRLEVSIPLRDISYSRHCALNVDSLFAGIQVDRTGYRFVDL
jgi:LmbE family N-acetylglucosaminyl deacetylase